MSDRKPFSFIITVGALAAAGAVLYYSIRQLPQDVGAAPSASVTGVSLHALAEAGNIAGLEAQLKAGAKIDSGLEDGPLAQRGMTPLMTAIFAGQEKAAEILLAAKPQLEARSRDGRSALIWAAGWGTPAMVQKLLDAGAEKNARDEANFTALIMAAARGDAKSVDILIKSGADINAKNKWNHTALMTAIRTGNKEKIDALLNAGAGANDADLDGLTPVHMAAESDAPVTTLEMIHKRGGNLDAQSAAGLTALMIAADRGDAEKVKTLLTLGAKASLKDKDGATALDWANRRADDTGKAVAELLQKTK